MRLFVSVLLLVLSGFSFAAEAPLRFSIADSWSMPMMLTDGEKPRDGFLFDIMQSLARQVGRPAEYHVLARWNAAKSMCVVMPRSRGCPTYPVTSSGACR
jgi:polar amino acid transport system substrate-binding protein